MWRASLWSEYHRAVLIAYEYQTAFGRCVAFLQIDSEFHPSYIASEIAIVRRDRDDFSSGIEIEHIASFPVGRKVSICAQIEIIPELYCDGRLYSGLL